MVLKFLLFSIVLILDCSCDQTTSNPNQLKPGYNGDDTNTLMKRLEQAESYAKVKEILKEALRNGADLGHKDTFGKNVLHYSLGGKNDTIDYHLVEQIIKAAPATVNEADRAGYVPLAKQGLPASHLTFDIIKLFIKNHFILKDNFIDNSNILHKLIESLKKPDGYAKSIALILEKGPELLNARNKEGKTPFELLIDRGMLTKNIYHELRINPNTRQSFDKIYEALINKIRALDDYKNLIKTQEFKDANVANQYKFVAFDGNDVFLFKSGDDRKNVFDAVKEIENPNPDAAKLEALAENYEFNISNLALYISSKALFPSGGKTIKVTLPPIPMSCNNLLTAKLVHDWNNFANRTFISQAEADFHKKALQTSLDAHLVLDQLNKTQGMGANAALKIINDYGLCQQDIATALK